MNNTKNETIIMKEKGFHPLLWLGLIITGIFVVASIVLMPFASMNILPFWINILMGILAIISGITIAVLWRSGRLK